MTALVARLRPGWNTLVGAAAEAAGRAIGRAARTVASLAPHIPGVAGPLLICYGLGEVYGPLRWISLGVFLLWLDRRT